VSVCNLHSPRRCALLLFRESISRNIVLNICRYFNDCRYLRKPGCKVFNRFFFLRRKLFTRCTSKIHALAVSILSAAFKIEEASHVRSVSSNSLSYTTPQKVQPIRIQESRCILDGITSKHPIMLHT